MRCLRWTRQPRDRAPFVFVDSFLLDSHDLTKYLFFLGNKHDRKLKCKVKWTYEGLRSFSSNWRRRYVKIHIWHYLNSSCLKIERIWRFWILDGTDECVKEVWTCLSFTLCNFKKSDKCFKKIILILTLWVFDNNIPDNNNSQIIRKYTKM